MMRLTLDTSCVIHRAQGQAFAEPFNELVDLAPEGLIGLWLTSASQDDQSRASSVHRQTNADWLRSRTVLGEVPGPFRLDHSKIGGEDVVLDDRTAEVGEVIERIVLSAGLGRGSLDINDRVQMARWRKRVTDVEHLIAHAMAGHDLFVTTDSEDILRKWEARRLEAGIEVAHPDVALLRVRASAGQPG